MTLIGDELSAEEKRDLRFNMSIDMILDNYTNSGPRDEDEDPAKVVGSWER